MVDMRNLKYFVWKEKSSKKFSDTLQLACHFFLFQLGLAPDSKRKGEGPSLLERDHFIGAIVKYLNTSTTLTSAVNA